MPQPYDIASLALPGDSEIPALLQAFPQAEVLRFGDEELLIRAGAEEEHFYLLLRGTVIVELPPPEPEDAPAPAVDDAPPPRHHGSEISLLTATPAKPLFLGEMACFGSGLRSAHVRSSMNSVALRLSTASLHRLLETFPSLTRTLCEQFSERLLELNEQLRRYRDVLFMKAEQQFFEPGHVLFEAGQEAALLYQLVDGAVTLSGETEETLRPGRSGAVFIEPLAYFRGSPHTRTATAKTQVIAVSIAAASREAVVRNFPHLMLQLFQQTAQAES